MPGSPSLAPASQFRQPKVTQASSTGPQGHCWLLPTEEGWAGLSTTTHAGPLAALPPEPHFCGLTLEYGLYALLAFLFVRLLVGHILLEAAWGHLRILPAPTRGSPGHRGRRGRKAGPWGDPDRWGSFFWRSSGPAVPGFQAACVQLWLCWLEEKSWTLQRD